MDGRNVFGLAQSGPRSFEEANDLAGILNRITEKYSKRVDILVARLEALDAAEVCLSAEVESEINKEIEDWNAKIRKLGGIPKGLWGVDIDAGDGYYCWKFPETEIKHWRGYQSGFNRRIPLSEKEKLMASPEMRGRDI